jgi:hypothetical protein
LSLPGRRDPEASVCIFFGAQTNGAYDLFGLGFEPERPLPNFAALDSREAYITNKGESAIGWIGPGHLRIEMANDFPLGKNFLDLVRVGEFEGSQKQARRFERSGQLVTSDKW